MAKQVFNAFIFCFFLGAGHGMLFSQISIGVRGGLLINNLAIDPLQNGEGTPEAVTGFQFAVPIEIGIGEIFAVQPEIMFGSHGVKRQANDSGTLLGVTTTVNVSSKGFVNALEVPVLGKAKFGTETFRFFVLAGPSMGFGIG
ncbi:MAG: porin family protein, partial [Saprospiraceae bacterium]|nr:porin family protein [Saprospiraceae bacterium]